MSGNLRLCHLTIAELAVAAALVAGSVAPAGAQSVATASVTGGDAHRGAVLIRSVGCGSCHTIPGIPGATGLVGPPLNQMSRRVYIAGVLRNSPENMIAWLQDPQRFVPGNAMPNIGLGRSDARDLTAYLYTLK
jgi:cytochrome c2